MNVNIYELISGAKKARGLTVIIDVFRAFSLECYLFSRGVREIYPIGDAEDAFRMKNDNPEMLLFGERKGAKIDGCDFGNSPSSVVGLDLSGKTVIHTSGAGTQGIVNASQADEIITGSLVNAKAAADYIIGRSPDEVSLVAMGNAGVRTAPEDVLCAEYIRSLILGYDIGIDERIAGLRYNGGTHFFRPDTQDVFPQEDYYLCAKKDVFDFVIRSERKDNGVIVNRKYCVGGSR